MATTEELETRLTALESRLSRQVGVNPLAPPITIGEIIDVPAPGSPIQSAWAQEVTYRSVHRFATAAQRDAAYPPASAGAGAMSWTTDFGGALWYCDGTTWKAISQTAVIGSISLYAGQTIPGGFLVCDGQQYSRVTWSELYAAIGNLYGAGDGTTTFNVPDLRGRVPIGVGTGPGLTQRDLAVWVGAENHQLTPNQGSVRPHAHWVDLPNHQHLNANNGYQYVTQSAGGGIQAIIINSGPNNVANEGWTSLAGTGSYSTREAAAWDAPEAHNNMQPSVGMNYMIYGGAH